MLAAVDRLDRLTAAERVVLKMIARNMTTQDIARELKVSPKTIENHRSKICHKLEITGNNALLRFALGCSQKVAELN
jgi:DNA-binding CsgD family transcriptional regulator